MWSFPYLFRSFGLLKPFLNVERNLTCRRHDNHFNPKWIQDSSSIWILLQPQSHCSDSFSQRSWYLLSLSHTHYELDISSPSYFGLFTFVESCHQSSVTKTFSLVSAIAQGSISDEVFHIPDLSCRYRLRPTHTNMFRPLRNAFNVSFLFYLHDSNASMFAVRL